MLIVNGCKNIISNVASYSGQTADVHKIGHVENRDLYKILICGLGTWVYNVHGYLKLLPISITLT